MRPKSVTTAVIWAAAVAGLGTWLAIEHQARLGLGERHKALEQQLEQMTALAARNEALSNRLGQASRQLAPGNAASRELLRLRGEVGVLRQQAQDFEAVRDENRQAHAALETSTKPQTATADYWPRNSWTFAGYLNPDAALKTSLWAMSNGDLKAALAGSTGEARKAMEDEFAGKSDEETSIRVSDQIFGLRSVRVLNRELQANDTALLTAEFEDRTGLHTAKLVMKKIGDEWKISDEAQ